MVIRNAPPSLRKKKAAVTLDTVNLTIQFGFAITQAITQACLKRHKQIHTCKHPCLHESIKTSTQTHFSSPLFHTHTKKARHHREALLSSCFECPTPLLRRAHEIRLSCLCLTSILDKANPNLYAAWQTATLWNANARDTLEVVALCGYLFFSLPLSLPLFFLFEEHYWSEPAGGSVCTCSINHSLSSLPLSLLLDIH